MSYTPFSFFLSIAMYISYAKVISRKFCNFYNMLSIFSYKLKRRDYLRKVTILSLNFLLIDLYVIR